MSESKSSEGEIESGKMPDIDIEARSIKSTSFSSPSTSLSSFSSHPVYGAVPVCEQVNLVLPLLHLLQQQHGTATPRLRRRQHATLLHERASGWAPKRRPCKACAAGFERGGPRTSQRLGRRGGIGENVAYRKSLCPLRGWVVRLNCSVWFSCRGGGACASYVNWHLVWEFITRLARTGTDISNTTSYADTLRRVSYSIPPGARTLVHTIMPTEFPPFYPQILKS